MAKIISNWPTVEVKPVSEEKPVIEKPKKEKKKKLVVEEGVSLFDKEFSFEE